jgi:para-aminobenzoate synthetase
MRCLIIDNYDSFTWNLADYVSVVYGREPIVVRNDQYRWDEIVEMGGFSSIIVSPGPGSVTNPEDFNISREALSQDRIPVFGVCLGFQGLAYIYGGRIDHAPIPFHGRRSVIRHDGSELFAGIPSSFDAVRYHSLIVGMDSIPSCLRVTARSECGLVMALRHATLPKWGLQFHPESIRTEFGKRIIANFRDLAHRSAQALERSPKISIPASTMAKAVPERDARNRRLHWREVDALASSEQIFLSLFADHQNAFWLDSQINREGMSRFSFMGCAAPDDVLSFSLSEPDALSRGRQHLAELERALEAVSVTAEHEPPFQFRGGYIGFMTYEMKAAFGATLSRGNRIPDSVWMCADRFLAFDHVDHRLWLVAVAAEDERPAVETWMATMASRIAALGANPYRPKSLDLKELTIKMNFSPEEYLEAIGRCKEEIFEGESYEICLTNSFSFDLDLDPIDLYLVMRRLNPAPFGAYIRHRDTHILSTSPERFLRVGADGKVQAKPIKGTCARADEPEQDRENAARLAASEKDQAENLMIVDLMRNDLARVSLPGSIAAPKLMEIESYQTVHQMVSTIESRLRPECTLIDLLNAVYPGGSITGAPKIRTMEIIDKIEAHPRGVYCGAIGYLGFNRIADINIAIRSLSYDGRTIRFGAGGAVTYLSDCEAELHETLLKAEAVLRPVWRYLSRPEAEFAYRLQGSSLRLRDPFVAVLAE